MRFGDYVFNRTTGEKGRLSGIMRGSDGRSYIKIQKTSGQPTWALKDLVEIRSPSFDIVSLIHELERIASTDGCLPCAGCRLYPMGNCQEKGCRFIRRAIELLGSAMDDGDFPNIVNSTAAKQCCEYCASNDQKRRVIGWSETTGDLKIEFNGEFAAIVGGDVGILIEYCPVCGRPLTKESMGVKEGQYGTGI